AAADRQPPLDGAPRSGESEAAHRADAARRSLSRRTRKSPARVRGAARHRARRGRLSRRQRRSLARAGDPHQSDGKRASRLSSRRASRTARAAAPARLRAGAHRSARSRTRPAGRRRGRRRRAARPRPRDRAQPRRRERRQHRPHAARRRRHDRAARRPGRAAAGGDAVVTLTPLILVVDDDPAIRESLERELRASGYTTASASDGAEGVRAFGTRAPDLVLTDLSMPRSDGFELISAIRATARTPILVLSVRGNDADKIRALDLGADDFVTKPFSVAELLARIRAQLRCVSSPVTTLTFDELSIDLERRRVVQGGRDIHLTPTEYALLELLATNAGRPIFTDT